MWLSQWSICQSWQHADQTKTTDELVFVRIGQLFFFFIYLFIFTIVKSNSKT